ncbi:hypothetical protein C5E02_03185 [Rathayibacter rathayi]|uniref:hypothetical protein n=1 Tax=Rathayibacter rathayi TaxID=33887 RepID=UPI000CE8BBE0|nr:hypothetical protein [Rathayibacter rathayi]MWV74264.1 hypothetical protein [Rathayibacter rathayi NCPPB 2980 = VKM Ac-1601]PPI64232.1 hypothetical protein C5E02_03185 [Rathayibacter rathayi]PPI73357.1 hypothetical protein C5D98_03335 [Rathayibacter rathayi]
MKHENRSFRVDSGWTIETMTERGLERRTLVQGAAWTIPVVGVTMATPAAAASSTPTLSFTNGPYAVDACGVLKDVVLKATTDGTTPVAAGTTISVTLPDQLKWSDGTTGTKSFPADANGQVTLSRITSSKNFSETVTVAAKRGSTSASAPVKVQKGTGAVAYQSDGTSAGTAYKDVPADSVSIGDITWLAPNGDLYKGNKVLVSNVKNAVHQFIKDNDVRINYMTKDGKAFQSDGTSAGTEYKKVPADSVSIGDITWLAPNGDLYKGDKVLVSNVKNAVHQFIKDNDVRINYMTKDGKAFQSDGTSAGTEYKKVPADSVSIGDITWLAPNGDLYKGDKVLVSNVKNAVHQFIKDNDVRINYVTERPSCA